MGRFIRQALGATLACYASANTLAAPPALKILYHEAIRPQTTLVSGHTQRMSFDAYGRRFNLVLEPNKALLDAVPAGRSDIEPLMGKIEGLSKSWVRLTRTRSGWHGLVSDGQELYGIEPAADVAGSTVQPLATGQGVIYRLEDALLPVGPAYCEILNTDGSVHTDSVAPSGRVTAKMLVDSMTAEAASASGAPNLEVTVGVVADYQFDQAFSDDPEGTIIARMDIVDGIWSSQVGVKIHLAPLTVINTAAEPFTATAPTDLLAQVRAYRTSHADQKLTGITHLMTGRDLDGEIVGISYLGSVCDSQTADSLSEGAHSALMSGLIAAHEIGHNFNAPHDGEAGACASTPQTYLMAPKLNFSSQFSSCSLDQINARLKTAQCVTPYQAPDVEVELPASSVGSTQSSPFTVVFFAHAIGSDPSENVSAQATLATNLTLQSVTAAGGTCTTDGNTVSCSLGTLQPDEKREIDLTMVGTSTGDATTTVAVASSNDYVMSNNSLQVAIQIIASSPPTAPVQGTGVPPGGGGGSLDLTALAVLGSAAARTVLRRRRKQ